MFSIKHFTFSTEQWFSPIASYFHKFPPFYIETHTHTVKVASGKVGFWEKAG